MHRPAAPSLRLAACLALMAACLSPPPATAGTKGGLVRAEPEPGRALVYFIRSSRFAGSARTLFLFSDEQFLGVLDNGTYSFAQVDPGRHLFWTNWTRVSKELELVPGRTYYLDCWAAISVLDATAGEALVEQVGTHVVPTDKERETAARYVRERHGKAEAREAKKEKADVAEAEPVLVPEAEREGRARLPEWTEVRLTLLEGITSAHDATGGAVLFRVTDDVVAEGQVVIRAGTPVAGVIRQAEKGKAGGVGGVLDVVVPSVTASDGTAVPVAGLVAEGGRDRTKAAGGAMVAFGVFGLLSVQGREAFHLRGETVVVATRGDAWLLPAPPEPLTQDRAVTEAPPPSLAARVEAPVELVPSRERHVGDVTVVVPMEADPASAVIVSVGGREPSRLPRAERISRVREDVVLTFDGWPVARLLEPGAPAGGNLAVIRMTLADGSERLAEVELPLLVKEKP